MLDLELVRQTTFVARVEHHRSIRSTNDRARQCAAEGPAELPLLILADAQTAGRGRGAKSWWTGRGSLAISLLLDLEQMGVAQSARPLVALATAVAVAKTVAPLVPDNPVGIRWPNDVLVAGRKISGILAEMLSPAASESSHALCVVGIGLNTNNRLDEAPDELRETATTLVNLTGAECNQTAILTTLLDELAAMLGDLAAKPERIARRADALCVQHGHVVTVETGDTGKASGTPRQITGRVAGIAPDGSLLLDTPGGRRAIYSGVVSSPASSSAGSQGLNTRWS